MRVYGVEYNGSVDWLIQDLRESLEYSQEWYFYHVGREEWDAALREEKEIIQIERELKELEKRC